MMEFDEITKLIDDAVERAKKREGKAGPRGAEQRTNGNDDAPWPSRSNNYGRCKPTGPAPRLLGPLAISDWVNRDLPEPDRLMGEWLTTTSRVVLNAPTGLGKTNFGMAMAGHVAAGIDFLHWRALRPARVLFIDGEMSRRLLKRRTDDVVRRLPIRPDGLYLLSHEDVENFQPLNTPAGKAFIERLADQIGGLDLIIFDNVMALIAGVMKEEEGWQDALPLVNSLTKRAIGQFWLHHTGLDKTHGYGTSTREWRMDTVLLATEAKRTDTDVSFTLEFTKARERTPETRRDFEPVTIALVNDEWQGSVAIAKPKRPSPLGAKFLEALRDAFTTVNIVPFQTWQAIKSADWRTECTRRGLLDPERDHSARTLFAKYKRELIAANLIGCDNELVWLR